MFSVGVTGPSAAEDIQKRANTHGAVAITGMGLLLPIGALIARYARAWDPAWFYTHLTVQLVGFLFLLVALGTGVELAHNIQPKGYDTHAGFGFFIFGLAILQVCFELTLLKNYFQNKVDVENCSIGSQAIYRILFQYVAGSHDALKYYS